MGGDVLSLYSFGMMGQGIPFMKQIKDKFKRTVKYWSISYKQASGRDRFSMGMFALLMLVYWWWVTLVF